jgi:CheY-like chemotaxis protein
MQQSIRLKKVAIMDGNLEWVTFKDGRLKEEVMEKQVQCFSKAANLLDHLQAIKKNKSTNGLPDYILIDMQLPDMNATNFFDRYEKIMGRSDTPEVFILSSSGNKKNRDLAMQYPFVSTYLEKPVPRDLIEVLVAGKSVDESPQ